MKTFLSLLATLIISLFISLPLHAAPQNTYVAKIKVSDQSESSKREAINKALSEILTKNSGNAKILDNKEIQEVLSKAHDYIQSYKYLNEKKRGAFQKFIQATFDKEEVDRIIQRANSFSTASIKETDETKPEQKPLENQMPGVPPSPKKPVLIWLATKSFNQTKPELIEYEKDQAIGKLVDLIAKQKNVSILIPELDVENITQGTAENIWSLDKTQIVEASTRYTDANILAGRLEQEGNGQWQGRWQFKNGEQWIELTTQGETPESNLSQIMDSIQSKTGSVASMSPEEPTSFLIQVHQISDLEKSAKLLEYLRQLPVIKNVDTVSLQPESVTLEIQANGGKSAFQSAIESEKRLIPTTILELDAPESSSSKNKIDLQYDWQEPLLPIAPEY